MKLYITAILIILFTSCSNKQFSFRDKVNVKREQVVKQNKPNKYHLPSKDSIINTSITAAVNETFLPTNNFVDGNNVVVNFQDTLPKNEQRITPSPIGKQKNETNTSPNSDKKTFPIYGLIGLVLSTLGALCFTLLWFSLPFKSPGILLTTILLILGLGFSVIGLKQPRKGMGIAGAIISAITLLIILGVLIVIILFLVILWFALMLGSV